LSLVYRLEVTSIYWYIRDPDLAGHNQQYDMRTFCVILPVQIFNGFVIFWLVGMVRMFEGTWTLLSTLILMSTCKNSRQQNK